MSAPRVEMGGSVESMQRIRGVGGGFVGVAKSMLMSISS
jgi:hypothetical protein